MSGKNLRTVFVTAVACVALAACGEKKKPAAAAEEAPAAPTAQSCQKEEKIFVKGAKACLDNPAKAKAYCAEDEGKVFFAASNECLPKDGAEKKCKDDGGKTYNPEDGTCKAGTAAPQAPTADSCKAANKVYVVGAPACLADDKAAEEYCKSKDQVFEKAENQCKAVPANNGGTTGGGNSEGGNSEGGNSEGGNSEGGNSEGGNSEGGNSEGGNSEGGNSEGGNSEGGNSEGGNSEGGNSEGGNSEGGNSEGGNSEGGNSEGGNSEGGNSEGGNSEGGNSEGGNSEGGNSEGGNSEGGNSEGGNSEGGNSEGDVTAIDQDRLDAMKEQYNDTINGVLENASVVVSAEKIDDTMMYKITAMKLEAKAKIIGDLLIDSSTNEEFELSFDSDWQKVATVNAVISGQESEVLLEAQCLNKMCNEMAIRLSAVGMTGVFRVRGEVSPEGELSFKVFKNVNEGDGVEVPAIESAAAADDSSEAVQEASEGNLDMQDDLLQLQLDSEALAESDDLESAEG